MSLTREPNGTLTVTGKVESLEVEFDASPTKGNGELPLRKTASKGRTLTVWFASYKVSSLTALLLMPQDDTTVTTGRRFTWSPCREDFSLNWRFLHLRLRIACDIRLSIKSLQWQQSTLYENKLRAVRSFTFGIPLVAQNPALQSKVVVMLWSRKCSSINWTCVSEARDKVRSEADQVSRSGQLNNSKHASGNSGNICTHSPNSRRCAFAPRL